MHGFGYEEECVTEFLLQAQCDVSQPLHLGIVLQLLPSAVQTPPQPLVLPLRQFLLQPRRPFLQLSLGCLIDVLLMV